MYGEIRGRAWCAPSPTPTPYASVTPATLSTPTNWMRSINVVFYFSKIIFLMRIQMVEQVKLVLEFNSFKFKCPVSNFQP